MGMNTLHPPYLLLVSNDDFDVIFLFFNYFY